MSDHRRIAQLEEQIKQLQSAQAVSTYSYSHPPASEEPTPQFSGPGPDQARQYTPLEQHIHPESSQHLRRFPYGQRMLRAGNHTPRWSGQIDDRSDAMWEVVYQTHQMVQNILQIVTQSTECVKELVKRVERLEHLWRSNMEKQHAESRLHSAPEIQRSNLSQPNPQYVQAQTPTSNSSWHSSNISFTSPAPSLRIPPEVPHPELSITQLPQPSLRSYEPQMTTPYIFNQPQSSAFIDQDLHPSYPLTDGFRERNKFDFWSGDGFEGWDTAKDRIKLLQSPGYNGITKGYTLGWNDQTIETEIESWNEELMMEARPSIHILNKNDEWVLAPNDHLEDFLNNTEEEDPYYDDDNDDRDNDTARDCIG